jgi:hypothetical protein
METLIFCFWPYWKTSISVVNQMSGYSKSCAEGSQKCILSAVNQYHFGTKISVSLTIFLSVFSCSALFWTVT